MNTNFKAAKQAGFTLIELIVVIVILGILAATALPKFANLGGDARAASLKAAKASISSVVAMAHAKALVNAAPATTVVMEGASVTMAVGYPKAALGLAHAAGLGDASGVSTDYDIATPTGTPAKVTVSPKNVADKTKCVVTYTETADANTPPVITEVTTDCN